MFKQGLIITSLLLTACATANLNMQRQERNCMIGSQCYQQLPSNLKAVKQQQAVYQREQMLKAQQNTRINSLWAIKPMGTYN